MSACRSPLSSPVVAPAARAQGTSPLIKYGKWVLAAGAVGMNVLADRSHDHADEQFGAIRDRCFANSALCAVDGDGRYVNRDTETLYQNSLRYDRHARRWLFGGETALQAPACARFATAGHRSLGGLLLRQHELLKRERDEDERHRQSDE